MIERELITDELHKADAIDGIIVTTPIPDGRVKLGAQVVLLLVEHGFSGKHKWQNVTQDDFRKIILRTHSIILSSCLVSQPAQ